MSERFHTIVRVERAEQVTSGQYQKAHNVSRGDYASDDPASLLEAAELVPEASHEELAQALGRILVWLLDGGSLRRIGERVVVMAYKLRPDTIEGATIRDIARKRGIKKSYVDRLSQQFTRIFGIRGLNGHAGARQRVQVRPDGARHGLNGLTPKSLPRVVNLFEEWRGEREQRGGAVPRDEASRRAMRAELEPIARFLAQLEG